MAETVKSSQSGHVLVFGDDMRIFLAVVRAFGRAGKIVHAAPYDMHSPALKSRFIAAVHQFPDYADDPGAWQKSVSEVLRSQAIELVVPCTDPAIITLDKHREAFAAHNIAIPPATAMAELFDKEQTHLMCARLGIPVSRAARLDPADTARGLVSAYGLPLVIKPRRSYWLDQLDKWGKVHIVENEAQLNAVLEGLNDRSRYLVEGYFEGAGVGVSVLVKDGMILQAFQHRRLREGKGGSSSYRISEPVNPELRLACERICDHTKLTGVCMFEFRVDMQTGRWVLLETNARFWGSMPLPVSLGLDYPNLLYDLVVRDIAKPERGYEVGVRSRNFLLDGYNLLKRLRQIRPANVIPWLVDAGDFCLQPLRWLTGKERSDTFVADDIRPALWECLATLKRR
jgi:predicted ATP-grasp superfamily ATP-dependent carboligase